MGYTVVCGKEAFRNKDILARQKHPETWQNGWNAETIINQQLS